MMEKHTTDSMKVFYQVLDLDENIHFGAYD